MSGFNNGGPAFATGGSGCRQSGMTLLDYFAGQALTGLVKTSSNAYPEPGAASRVAYDFAQAMIEERNRRYRTSQDSDARRGGF